MNVSLMTGDTPLLEFNSNDTPNFTDVCRVFPVQEHRSTLLSLTDNHQTKGVAYDSRFHEVHDNERRQLSSSDF